MKRTLCTFVTCISALTFCTFHSTAQTAFEKIVAEKGYDQNIQDLSDATTIKIQEPSLALVNITGFSSMPTQKYNTRKGFIEVYDGNGHYFRKPITAAVQGGYSIRYPKKNFVCHFTDEQWNEDGAPELKIGDWVKQDAFHFKAFYNDFIRGLGEVGYKLFAQMVADRQPYWERGGYFNSSAARCFPDGFPCAVYLNGKFYGIFAWQLKKHRKNMNQKKKQAEHIHLDGNLNDQTIFRGRISWFQFEVRTPKGLYNKNGAEYNGNSPSELIDESCATYDLESDSDSIRADKQLSAQTKKHIVAMSKYWEELNNIEKSGATSAQMRNEIELRYDTEAMIDYAVHYQFTYNGDGSLKNWQWFTYDGQHWAVTPYDLDQTFGIGLYGQIASPDRPIDLLTSGPFYWLNKYYKDDIAERYATLRKANVLDYDNVIAIINDWYERVGEEFYDQEKEQWPNSPCYNDVVCNEGWEVCQMYDPEYYVSGHTPYSDSQEYHPGDVCSLEGRFWRATATVQGVKPFIVNANRDSMDRLQTWINGRIEFLDAYFAYDDTNNIVDNNVAEAPANFRRLAGIYTLGGIKVKSTTPGQTYIFRYNDGTTRKAIMR